MQHNVLWNIVLYWTCVTRGLEFSEQLSTLLTLKQWLYYSVWMAPFSFLIDDHWVQSDGNSVLENTQEETTAKTDFLSNCSLNFKLERC